MSFQPGAMLNTQSFGNRPESVEVPHIDTRAPTSADVRDATCLVYPIGKQWVDKQNNASYVLTSLSSPSGILTANWVDTAGGSGSFTTLAVTGLSTLGALTQIGTASINASGAAVTTIGTGGTGAVNIGNATGNVAVTGKLTASTGLQATAGGVINAAGAIATTATSGFMYNASCAGTPTGVPTTVTGSVPFIFDTSTGTGKLWAYIGGSWVGVALS